MKATIIGKNIEVTSALKQTIEKKLTRLDKYFGEEHIAHVKLVVQKNKQTIEVSIPLSGVIIRSEESTEDMYASIDLVLDKLERQIRKQKTKLEKRLHSDSLRFHEITAYETAVTDDGEEKGNIVRTKKFAIKPMNQEEAALQMELLGHNFFVFMNDESEEVNVVYKRKDGNYGLIEPKF
ncbi:MAG: ribosome-associated translation inhibitor RaiA [Clostridiaceae bacterium]